MGRHDDNLLRTLDFAEHPLVAIDHAGQGELGLDPAPSGRAEPAPPLGIGHEGTHRVGQRIRVAGRNQQTRLTVATDQLRGATGIGGDDRTTARHCLPDGVGKDLLQRGMHHDIGGGQGGDDLVGLQEAGEKRG